ncbi:PEP-CTERM/exosortase system-associated acyltransferase [uncultured Thiodictyon sp.]|uniref:PEP-CTERM/exosortase system-associated acyltransferase n=1 Tax=uncultured Thiodictyon sp. TaxID=1846217 RepID=UPI0025DDB105|nr:PEP-CTERM/exosortase system-associated acyltransferase [uncultured Thiodictyon sp.]
MTIIEPFNPQHWIYTNYFEFFRAEGAEALAEAFRVRYQVYCEERGFLPSSEYPDHLERDRYDRSAVQLVGRHRFNQQTAGTARLILHSPLGFPLQRHCDFNPDYAYFRKPGHPALERYAEISRLAVGKTFRHRIDDTIYGGPARPHPTTVADEIDLRPPEAGHEIIAGLYKLIYHETKRQGITHWVVAMERSLQLLLKRIGYHFHPIGPVVDYYGPVSPYVLEVETMERHLQKRRPAIFAYWMQGLEPEFAPDLRK